MESHSKHHASDQSTSSENPSRQPSSEIPSVSTSFRLSIDDFLSFTSQLTSLCPILQPCLRELLAVDVIVVLLCSKFPKFFAMASESLSQSFIEIKSQINSSKPLNYSLLERLTMSLIRNSHSFIENSIGNPLTPDLIFTLMTSAELFRVIQQVPLELVITATRNCFKTGLNLADTRSIPTVYSLFCNDSYPFLPVYPHKEFTLVLDLDETLGHYCQERFLVRPGVNEFLSEMNQNFELVLFTASSREYADWAMSFADPYGCVKLRLYRQHTDEQQVKDLAMLGRDISRVIIIDNLCKSFEKQPDNGLEISSWLGDVEDAELTKLSKYLQLIPHGQFMSLKQELARIQRALTKTSGI